MTIGARSRVDISTVEDSIVINTSGGDIIIDAGVDGDASSVKIKAANDIDLRYGWGRFYWFSLVLFFKGKINYLSKAYVTRQHETHVLLQNIVF